MQVPISIMLSIRSLLSASIVPIDPCNSLTASRRASKSSMETMSSQEHPSEGVLVVSALVVVSIVVVVD